MTERTRCYIDAEGPDDEEVRMGLAWLVAWHGVLLGSVEHK